MSATATSEPGLAIRVENLRVDYEVFEDRRAALRQRLIKRSGPGRSLIHAVRGVSFDVREGESVGIMGPNGSGKSTLLAAMAGLVPVTSGQVRVSAEPRMLGVGAALIPKAPGRRNVRIGLLALGVSRRDLDEAAAEVIEWAQLGEAIDRPLRTYSSGMKARLQFAIATWVSPEILFIDEALGVGDKRFRAKSRERLSTLKESAGALMMVNHSLNELAASCERGMWIEEGELVADGPIDEVIEQYEAS